MGQIIARLSRNIKRFPQIEKISMNNACLLKYEINNSKEN